MLDKSIEYKNKFLEYETLINRLVKSTAYEHTIETSFEALHIKVISRTVKSKFLIWSERTTPSIDNPNGKETSKG